jgi:hypothetical protein
MHVPSRAHRGVVALGPASCAGTSLPSCGVFDAKPVIVNGIDAYPSTSKNKWVVPQLGVTITLTGPTSNKVFHTLTSSPRVIALAPGPPPDVPSSWHRISFDGISVAVPASWPSLDVGPIWGGDIGFSESEVVLDDGGLWTGISATGQLPVYQTSSALLIERVVDPVGAKSGPCIHINGLSACPDTTTSVDSLPLLVHVPGQKEPVGVEIGLARNGIVARTILYSMRAG